VPVRIRVRASFFLARVSVNEESHESLPFLSLWRKTDSEVSRSVPTVPALSAQGIGVLWRRGRQVRRCSEDVARDHCHAWETIQIEKEAKEEKSSTSTPYSWGRKDTMRPPQQKEPRLHTAQTLRAACDDACNLALNERILVPDPDPGKLAICPVTALVGAFWNVAVRASGIRA
jgi:hypothetical protein